MEYTTPSSFDNVTAIITANDSRSGGGCEDFSRAEFVGYFFVQPIICIVGFILNLVNVFVFLRGKQFSGSSTYRLMMILSVFDALTLLLTFPLSFVRCKNYLKLCNDESLRNIRYGIFRWHIYAGVFLINTSEAVSCWMTVLLSVERYISIKHHYIIKAHFNTSNVHKLIFIIVLVCVVINAPISFAQELFPIYQNVSIERNITANISEIVYEQKFGGYHARLSAFGKSPYYGPYSWMRIIIFNFVPLIFLSLINAFLIFIVRSSGHFRKHSSQTRSGEKRMKAQRNLTILLVTVIFLFLTGQIPQAFSHTRVFAVLCLFGKVSCCIFYKHYRMLCSLMCLVTYATNFFIYQTLNKHFRAEIYRLCRVFQVRTGRQNRPATEVVAGEAVELVDRKNKQENHGAVKADAQHLSVGNGELEAPSETQELPVKTNG